MDDRTLNGLLRRFGLSDKEIDTYLSLLEHGEAKASTIADAAGVSKRYVYSVSESLENRGFVEVNDHVVPTTIRANPPDEVINRLRSDADAIRPGLEERFSRTERRAEQFEVIKSRVTVIKRIRSLLDDAESEVTLSIAAKHLPEVRESLADAVDRGVLVLLLVSDDGKAPAGGAEDGSTELDGVASVVRTWSEAMPTLLTVDSAAGVVAPPELLRRSDTDRQAIHFRQEQLAPVIVGSFLGNYWPAASEVATAPPAALPAEYANFRHTLFQVTLHLRAGETPRVTVGGRRTDGDEAVELVGRVVEAKQGMVEPTNNEFPVQHSLVVETADGTVTVGGKGAFVEDVEADLVRIEAGDPDGSDSTGEADGARAVDE
ncbi:TrmB family transcriptional regulator sugar-binding domain-containing protein [Halorubrum sp. AD140]|uniref:TrmB family transcriptional regulator n=1 Tax=Halorubrum sp. AD140 TaxID=3050073 RepID=UPI002ACC5BD9|nr:TrmB family transcriptional regulator sugar-binding domain-containing protein [Halorubrum sp. AD140]MDZ5812167.1 TrmB family transcriptional regulator sugar-binding domain-containing protein [Halorubrum sp. AD140]